MVHYSLVAVTVAQKQHKHTNTNNSGFFIDHYSGKTIEIVHQWVYASILKWNIKGAGDGGVSADATININNNMTSEMKKHVVDKLFRIASSSSSVDGANNNNTSRTITSGSSSIRDKKMFKMSITDFGKIAKGETAMDTLITYSL